MNRIDTYNLLIDLKYLLDNQSKMTEAEFKQKFTTTFDKLKVAAGIVELDHAEFGPLDFVAQIIMSHEREVRPRWWAASAGVKEEFRQKAINTVASWATEEMKMRMMSGHVPSSLIKKG
jgi:hypothetical protein